MTDRLTKILGWDGARADARIRQLLDEVHIREPDRVHALPTRTSFPAACASAC